MFPHEARGAGLDRGRRNRENPNSAEPSVRADSEIEMESKGNGEGRPDKPADPRVPQPGNGKVRKPGESPPAPLKQSVDSAIGRFRERKENWDAAVSQAVDGKSRKPGEAAPPGQQKPPEDSAADRLRGKGDSGSRARKAVYASSAVLIVLITAVFAGHRYCYVKYRDLYEEQAWIQIRTVYDQLERNLILEVNRDKTIRSLENKWLGKEVIFAGVYCRTGTTSGGVEEILVDVPNLREALNKFDDDVHYEIPAGGPTAEGLARGDIVIGKGKVLNFSHFLIRLQGVEIRKAGPIEEYFLREWASDLSFVRESLGGFGALREGK